MSHIELSHLVQSIIEMVQIFPSVVFDPIALPLDQVLYFLAEQSTVSDGHGNEFPHGYRSTGATGTGMGVKFFSCDVPVPIWASDGSVTDSVQNIDA